MTEHNLEAIILGAMMVDPSCISVVMPIVKEDFFDLPQHKHVFRAISAVFKSSAPVDIMTVVSELKRVGRFQDVGGAVFVSRLTNGVASGVNVEYHCRILNQHYIMRELGKFGHYLTQQTQIPSTDCFELIGKVSAKISELTEFASNNVVTVGDVFSELVNEIKEVQKSGKPLGIMSGLENLDKITGGWQKDALYIIAARPAMGKTAFALKLVKTPAIEFNRPVAFFSLEMSSIELVGRLASSESMVNSTLISQRAVNSEQLVKMGAGCAKLIDAPIYIDDTPALKMADLKAKARRMVYEFKVELIVIDYLQLMSGDERGNREQEISYISRNLKALAKELTIPIIALSQLSRKVEERSDKRPTLSDLRESGSIEQDADAVFFLWRPEYYDLCEQGYDYGTQVLDQKGLLIVDAAKARSFKTGEIPLKFYGEFMIIDNYKLRNDEPTDYSQPAPLEINNDFLTDKF